MRILLVLGLLLSRIRTTGK